MVVVEVGQDDPDDGVAVEPDARERRGDQVLRAFGPGVDEGDLVPVAPQPALADGDRDAGQGLGKLRIPSR